MSEKTKGELGFAKGRQEYVLVGLSATDWIN